MYSFGFYCRISGLALSTQGLVYEYNTTAVEYVTPLGITVQGLAVGRSDFWHYAETPAAITWTYVDPT